MELDYDKEIDALLRRKDFSPPAVGFPDTEHLGADEISAFAENSLPGATRGIYMRHLASCDRCRKTLAHAISLTTESEIPQWEKATPVVNAAAAGPWYRGLFRFPGLAYAMGGLIVIFAGFLTFSIFQNTGNNQSAEVSQMDTLKPAAQGPSASEASPDYADSANSASNSNASSAVDGMPETSEAYSAAANAGLVGVNVAPGNAADHESRIAKRESDRFQVGGAAPSAPPAAGSTADSVTSSPQDKDIAGLSLSARKVENLPSLAQSEAERQDGASTARANRNSMDTKSKSMSGPSRDMNSQIQNAMNQAPQFSTGNGAGKVAGPSGRHYLAGRVFEFKQGVWYDTNFAGQQTTNFRRGTKAYAQLEPALQNAANYIGGTVVIVWKSKAYRIQ